ncbi:hypothetical protein GCM10009122_55370 [Fulvivirga kasyanovii]|uniref:Uncharacterized protein n=1 Tax=Fulvivirga kasyanovii TaxID=396812 RepID=A0ABW9RMG7_9BACT|nr:hypothetical protein [Fulvivirga kasyanovii]MTI25135.1 hypothetical protein [Fulvivirga kasyanovii]
MKWISDKKATYILVAILSLVIVFHMLILLGLVPFEIVWGGRLKNASEMVIFELISIAINIAMLTVVCIHGGIIKTNVKHGLLKGFLWIMFFLFLLNTIGNIASNNIYEKMIFTPLTLLLAVLSLRLAVSKK